MTEFKWSESEKKLARRVFERTLAAELNEILADFKAQAAAATEADDMWRIQDFLYHKRREIDEKYDYRYGQLIIVFGRLLREGRIGAEELSGLAEEKLAHIWSIASL